MILPSDSDPPPDRRDGDTPSEEPEDTTKWWEGAESGSADGPSAEADDFGDFLDDDDDVPGPKLHSVAGPGWRDDLYKDLLESLRDLEAIEDPDDDFAPAEPPDLYTFFGELAALRHEFRHEGLRTQQALAKLAQNFPGAPPGSVRRKSKTGSETPVPEPWPVETCLALISAWDLLPQAASAAAYASSLQTLVEAAGLTRIPTVGQTFDPATMTRAGTEPGAKKLPPAPSSARSLPVSSAPARCSVPPELL